MHFWVFATRGWGGFSVPRKYGLNWFMPALVKSSVGSSCGTTGDDGTKGWPRFWQKKSMNCWRTSFAVGMENLKRIHHRGAEAQRRQKRVFILLPSLCLCGYFC